MHEILFKQSECAIRLSPMVQDLGALTASDPLSVDNHALPPGMTGVAEPGDLEVAKPPAQLHHHPEEASHDGIAAVLAATAIPD